MVADRVPSRNVFWTASLVADNSKNTNSTLWKVKLLNEMNCEATRENAALNKAP